MSKRLAVVLGLALALGGCADPYGACEKGAADIATGISGGMKDVDALRVAGLISVQEETDVLGFLKYANDADAAFGKCAQSAHTAGTKTGAFTACAQVFATTLNDPQQLALIRVTNAKSQAKIQEIVNSVTTGITALLTALAGK